MATTLNGRTFTMGLACLGALVLGCGDNLATADGDTAQIELALTTVPTGIQCINILAMTGSTMTTRQFTVTAGSSSAALTLGQMPSGVTTLSGSAYNVACASISGATASYVADALVVTLRPGVLTSAEMTFRPNNNVGLSVNFLSNVAEIAAGYFATFARMTDGTLRFWGSDPVLGFNQSATTVSQPSLTGAASIAVGQNTGCILKTNGQVVCWGYINDVNSYIQPTTVSLPGTATQVVLSRSHACALMSNSSLVACWGNDNAAGQLGNGSTALASTSAPSLVNVGTVGKVVVGFRTTCVIDSGGRAQCWGENGGKFGNGVTGNTFAPSPAASGLGAITDLKLGEQHACATRADGAVFCWGNNALGQVGDGTTTTRLSPVQITALSKVTQVATGIFYSCSVNQSGQLHCWGSNGTGQLGDGTGLNQLSPVLVTTNASAVRANGGQHTCAEMTDLTVRCWGYNGAGQLGIGSLANASIPTPVRLQ